MYYEAEEKFKEKKSEFKQYEDIYKKIYVLQQYFLIFFK